jgi:hypothetical protein
MSWKEHSSRFSSDAGWPWTIRFQGRLEHRMPFVWVPGPRFGTLYEAAYIQGEQVSYIAFIPVIQIN